MATRKPFNSDGRTADDRALDTFANMMIRRIEEVQSDWQKPWIGAAGGGWPKNLQGRRYSGGNALMLFLHAQDKGYTIPVYSTFQGIVNLNYSKQQDGTRKPLLDADGNQRPTVMVNRGEHSFPVRLTTYTVVNKETKERIPYDDYQKLTDDEKKKYAVFPKLNVFQVFNVAAQTNIKEARPELYARLEAENSPKRPELQEGERYTYPPLDAMIKHNGWVCPIYEDTENDCYYSISNDEIHTVRTENYINGESRVCSITHEMSHSTGVEGRLDRFKGGSSPTSPEYAREELVAELTAALVCSNLGLEKTLKEDSAPYLKGWLTSLHESPDFIKTVLNDVKRSSSVIISRFEAIQQRIDKGYDNPIPEEPVFAKAKTPTVVRQSEELAARAMPTQEWQYEERHSSWHR